MIDTDETPEEVAIRETREEIGIEISELMPICHYLVSPGGCTESVLVYAGRVDSQVVDGFHGLDHEGEDIRPFAVPLIDAYQGISSRRIINGLTIIALQWMMLNKDQVIKAWR
jgi:ADP-ribose pyrophosphatase